MRAEQLPAAAKLAPRTEVRVDDHLGKPRHLGADAAADAATLAEWRANMAVMALPQVYVKLSMLGYCVPGWDQDAAKEATVAALARGDPPRRELHVRVEWHVNGAVPMVPAAHAEGPAMPDLYAKLQSGGGAAGGDQAKLFAGTAAEFYRI